MVNVTHDGYYRSSRLCIVGNVTVIEKFFFKFVFLADNNLVTHFFGNEGCGFLVYNLIDGYHFTELHEYLDHFGGLYRHLLCKFSHGDGFTDNDISGYRSDRLVECMHLLVELCTALELLLMLCILLAGHFVVVFVFGTCALG